MKQKLLLFFGCLLFSGLLYFNVQQVEGEYTSIMSLTQISETEAMATNCDDPCDYPCYNAEGCNAEYVAQGRRYIGGSTLYCGVVNGSLCEVYRCDYGRGNCNVSAQGFCDEEC